VIVAFVTTTYWFVPNVWLLRDSSITVTRWERQRGEVQVDVGPEHPNWVTTKDVSRHLLNAIVVAEDARFYLHRGLDWVEIEKSARLNWKERRFARGVSTITQQVIKISLLTRDKTLIRKAREALGAIILERILTKEDILTWYINLAEFGDGVYGIKEAAHHYFATKPELLTIQQSIHLAMVLPSPNRWSLGLRRRQLTEFGHRRFANLVYRMARKGMITQEQKQSVLATGNFGNPVAGYQSLISEPEPVETIPTEEEGGEPEDDKSPA